MAVSTRTLRTQEDGFRFSPYRIIWGQGEQFQGDREGRPYDKACRGDPRGRPGTRHLLEQIGICYNVIDVFFTKF